MCGSSEGELEGQDERKKTGESRQKRQEECQTLEHDASEGDESHDCVERKGRNGRRERREEGEEVLVVHARGGQCGWETRSCTSWRQDQAASRLQLAFSLLHTFGPHTARSWLLVACTGCPHACPTSLLPHLYIPGLAARCFYPIISSTSIALSP